MSNIVQDAIGEAGIYRESPTANYINATALLTAFETMKAEYEKEDCTYIKSFEVYKLKGKIELLTDLINSIK